MRKGSGFTLIEMMVAISILAILVGIAVPSFDNIALSSRLTSYSNDLVAAATVARSEAIKRNSQTTLCARNENACGGDWRNGWVVLNGATVVRAYPAIAQGYNISGDATTIRFPATGVGTTQAALTVCRASPQGDQARLVTVSATGRASVEKKQTTACP